MGSLCKHYKYHFTKSEVYVCKFGNLNLMKYIFIREILLAILLIFFIFNYINYLKKKKNTEEKVLIVFT